MKIINENDRSFQSGLIFVSGGEFFHHDLLALISG